MHSEDPGHRDPGVGTPRPAAPATGGRPETGIPPETGTSPRPSTRDLAGPPRPGTAPAAKPASTPTSPPAAAPAAKPETEDRSMPRGLPDDSSAERLAREDQALLEPGEAKGFRTEWQSIQSDFVDHPKEAVRSADALVAEVIRTLAASFASHKESLEAQWAKGDDVVTEDLRVALQRYRSFFNRLLST